MSGSSGRLPMPGTHALITCEHGGNRVPARYRPLFLGHAGLLHSHRGYDPGALNLARELAVALGAPLVVSTVSRLIIDLNRSPGHPRLYSDLTRTLPPAARREILRRYYLPYREQVEGRIAAQVSGGSRVLHISAHSFTPVLGNEVRNADVGLLYDPRRPAEAVFCRRWQQAIQSLAADIRVRRNYPYTGRSDGLTAWLRRRFPAAYYLGIELEVNQRYPLGGGPAWRELRALIIEGLRRSIEMHQFDTDGCRHPNGDGDQLSRCRYL